MPLLTHTQLKIDKLNGCRLASSLDFQKRDLHLVIDNPLIVVLCTAARLEFRKNVMPLPRFKSVRNRAASGLRSWRQHRSCTLSIAWA
jgi:hypothetical protein